MKFIDILILTICLGGLVYFILDRIKYSNVKAYRKKLEEFNKLTTQSGKITADNEETEKLIIFLNSDMEINDSLAGRFIKYRDDSDRLKIINNEIVKLKKDLDKYKYLPF